VPTHNSGAMEFHNGAIITVTISFDVHKHGHSPIELYGTEGSLKVPDPNGFGGQIEYYSPTAKAWKEQGFSHPYAENMRSIGAADMAMAIRNGDRRHRCHGDLAYHVLEVMHAFERSSTSGQQVLIESRPPQPEALPLGLIEGRV